MTPHFLVDGPADASATLILAHGAGAPMDSDFMAVFARGLADVGHRVIRFEFPYMTARRVEGGRRPPDRQDRLLQSWRDSIDAVRDQFGPAVLAIGGKSLGGRMASLLADDAGVAGLVCLGYPFHPPGRPEKLRTAHLATLRTATLMVQGSRDPFGGRAEVSGYNLSPAIRLCWAEDGDHNLKPRKASGRNEAQNRADAIAAVAAFLQELAP